MFQSLFYWTSESNLREAQEDRLEEKFQSLFYWTSESNACFCGRGFRTGKFQSLFYWTSESNWFLVMLLAAIWRVSILVLLDFRIKRSDITLLYRNRGVFQSLFYWTSESNPTTRKPTTRRTDVSILVLLDFRIKQYPLSLFLASISVSILVLLDFRIKHSAANRPLPTRKRFNPCFIGLQNQTLIRNSNFLYRFLFQSLFYWTSESNVQSKFHLQKQT